LKPKITFFNEEIKFNLSNKTTIRNWLVNITSSYGFTINTLNYIFCSDDYLLHFNQQFLAHDTFTDIITFDYTVPSKAASKAIAGEIYISIERVKENANTFKTSYVNELHRIMIHGVLHLCGFKDKKAHEQKEMRKQEDVALKVLESVI
jgi:rRNA maturation RNase YbeY